MRVRLCARHTRWLSGTLPPASVITKWGTSDSKSPEPPQKPQRVTVQGRGSKSGKMTARGPWASPEATNKKNLTCYLEIFAKGKAILYCMGRQGTNELVIQNSCFFHLPAPKETRKLEGVMGDSRQSAQLGDEGPLELDRPKAGPGVSSSGPSSQPSTRPGEGGGHLSCAEPLDFSLSGRNHLPIH